MWKGFSTFYPQEQHSLIFRDLGRTALSLPHSFGKWREDFTVMQRLGRPRRAALWEQTMGGDRGIENGTKVRRRLLIFDHGTFSWQSLSLQLQLRCCLLRKVFRVLTFFFLISHYWTDRNNRRLVWRLLLLLSAYTFTVRSAFCNVALRLTETFTLTNVQVHFAKSICVEDKTQSRTIITWSTSARAVVNPF